MTGAARLSSEQEAALDLRRSVALTAGAGSGKTRVLIERYLRDLVVADNQDVTCYLDQQKGKIMNFKLATTCFVVASFMGAVVAHAEDADSDRSHPVAFVKDSVITMKVKAKLAHAHIRSLAHIQVDTDSAGAVSLSGNVRNQKQADKAVAIARGTENVTSVTSNLQIKKDD